VEPELLLASSGYQRDVLADDFGLEILGNPDGGDIG
jgi:hypothetical protein